MSAQTASAKASLDELERKLAKAYEQYGLKPAPRQPLRDDDPESLLLHVQMAEKELRQLKRLLARKRERPRVGLRRRLKRLRPRSVSASLSQLGLFDGNLDVDEFGASHRVYERLRPLLRYLFDDYWRAEALNVYNVPPEGPALLVANHGGLLPFDALMLRIAIEEMHPSGRAPRALIEDWFMRLPFVNTLMTRLGALRGSPENAARLLDQGHLVALFPEGAKGVVKPYRQRYQVQRFGRGGAIRLALRHRAPIVPVGMIGSEEIYPLLLRARLPVSQGGGLDFLPITPLFPHFGAAGLVPLPAKWMLRFGEPMRFDEFPEEAADDDILVSTLNEELRARVQDLVEDLLKRRRSPWTG